jgi:hypothetical protein
MQQIENKMTYDSLKKETLQTVWNENRVRWL